jgi:hypothetical protein
MCHHYVQYYYLEREYKAKATGVENPITGMTPLCILEDTASIDQIP